MPKPLKNSSCNPLFPRKLPIFPKKFQPICHGVSAATLGWNNLCYCSFDRKGVSFRKCLYHSLLHIHTIMITTLPTICSLVSGLWLLCITAIQAQAWKVAKNKQGIKIETRFIEGWNIKQYRATVTIKTTLEEAVEAYRDPAQRKKYMTRSLEVSNLKEINRDHIITYNLGDAPWPVVDRDNITRSRFYRSSKQVKITMESIADYIPEKKGIIRVPRSEGYWLFTDMGDGTVKVVQQSVADLGGSVPDWVVNSTIVEGPYDVLLSMKKLLEK